MRCRRHVLYVDNSIRPGRALDGRKVDEECRLTRTEASLSDALDLRVCATPFQWRGEEHVVFVACDIADEKRRQVLEASPEGRTVTLACAETAGGITFTCHNEQAMPREIQLQVFQRSFSTKGRDRGIGTYSIKLLTERYLGGRGSGRLAPAQVQSDRANLIDLPRLGILSSLM